MWCVSEANSVARLSCASLVGGHERMSVPLRDQGNPQQRWACNMVGTSRKRPEEGGGWKHCTMKMGTHAFTATTRRGKLMNYPKGVAPASMTRRTFHTLRTTTTIEGNTTVENSVERRR